MQTCKLVDTNKVQMNAQCVSRPHVIYPGRKSVLTFALDGKKYEQVR